MRIKLNGISVDTEAINELKRMKENGVDFNSLKEKAANNNVKEPKPIVKILMGLLCLLVGIGLISFGIKKMNDFKEKNKTYIETIAKVVDYKDDFDSDGDRMQAEIVEYTVNGETYRATSPDSSTDPDALGSEVKIKYNPNNPEEVIWVGDNTHIILFIVGGVFALVGLFILVSHRKSNEFQP